MRNTLTLASLLFVLLFSFTSCLEEENDTVITPGPETEIAQGKMTYRGVESDIVAVYDLNGSAVGLGDSEEVGYATLIVSNRNMQSGGERLTQSADVLILNVITGGSIEGTYRASDWNNPNAQFFANICTNMNFATGTMDDDEGMESGETVITDNGDGTHTVSFSHVTDGRNVLEGSWTGELTRATN